jgi:hypothetical protein
MDDFSVLAGPLEYVDSIQKVEWNYLHAQKRYIIFITEFALLYKNPPFYEKKRRVSEKGFAHGGISKIFILDHFSLSFLGQKY